MLLLSSLTTYSRLPFVVRLIGSHPPELIGVPASCSPVLVTRNALMVPSARFGPALTTNSSRPSRVRLIEPAESTIGNPNGGWDAMPTPPVGKLARFVSVPFALRVY